MFEWHWTIKQVIKDVYLDLGEHSQLYRFGVNAHHRRKGNINLHRTKIVQSSNNGTCTKIHVEGKEGGVKAIVEIGKTVEK